MIQATIEPFGHTSPALADAAHRIETAHVTANVGIGQLAFFFDQLSVGIILLDRLARVVFANPAAQSLSKDGGPLHLNGTVTSRSSTHDRHLGDLIRSVLSGASVRTMSLPSSEGGRSVLILASPVRGAINERSGVRSLCTAVAMLLICDPNRPTQVPAEWMMDAYGLTLAEVRVALAVAAGATIANTARQLKISPNTVKTHLRRIYEKTGTNRQADLCRLVATISLARSCEACG